MDKPTCRYIVKVRAAYPIKKTEEIEFIATEKKFENKNPILAREEAFGFRNLILAGLFDASGLDIKEMGWNETEKRFENLSEREIRKLLNPYLEPENESLKTILRIDDSEDREVEWQPPDDTITWYPLYNNGIWVIMEHNDPELLDDLGEDIVIDKITRFEEPLPTPPYFNNLKLEFEFYKKYQFDTKSYETSVLFFDDEAFLNGTEEDDCYVKFNLLKTPFDWSGYDKIYWWSKNSDKNTSDESTLITDKLPISMNTAFAKGESIYAEYKPGLINWPHSKRNIEYEIAQTICAFLNAKGGYLFIGVADKKKKIIGLKFPNDSKDKFLREFTRIKTRYLRPHLAHTINGDFYLVGGEEIFAITVPPNDEQVFLRIKDNSNKIVSKEFYIRSDAASRHIYDMEEIVRYIRKRWK